MRYWWDKIKLVTDDLTKWDNLQILWFDTCGFALIWKWSDDYWTEWEAITTETEECREAGNCPNCQEVINDVADLPGRPTPCSSWDAFLMMTKSWTLKALCKDNFECDDKYVAISSWDEEPGYLADKLVVCDDDWPITLTENTSGSFHTMCIGWDASNAWLNFTDLLDTPSTYDAPSLLVSTANGIDYFKPSSCSDQDYAYIVYNKNSSSFDTLCPIDTSLVTWELTSDYDILCPTWQTWSNHVQNNSSVRMFSTSDITAGSWDVLFYLTRPGVYILSLNSTLMNEDAAWLKAARWWLTLNGSEIWDAKYDWRSWSKYVNDEYPNEYQSHEWMARDMDLEIMSFNTTYIITLPNISKSSPARIWFAVKLDCRTEADIRHTWEKPDNNIVHCKLTSWVSEEWPKTYISAARIWEIPETFEQRL